MVGFKNKLNFFINNFCLIYFFFPLDDYTVALALKYGAMVTARRCNIHCSANIAEALGTGIDHFRGIHCKYIYGHLDTTGSEMSLSNL